MSGKRPLSQIEKIFWRLSNVGTLNFTMIARCRGSLEEGSLLSALNHVQRLHPLLQVRIDVTSGKPVFQSDGVAGIPLRIVDAPNSEIALTTCLEEEMYQPFPWEQGPLVRCVWLRSEGDLHYLLVTFHHSISDGLSGTVFIRDLLEVLSGEKIADEIPKIANQELPAALDQRFPAAMRGMRGFFSTLKVVKHLRKQDSKYGEPCSIPADKDLEPVEQQSYVFIREFDEAITRELIDKARQQQTTVHGALTAAICLVLAEEISQGEPVSIKHRYPVSLRNELEPAVKNEIGLFASLIFFRCKLSGTEEFWEVARDVQAQHQENMQLGTPVGMIKLLSTLFQAIRGDKIADEALIKHWHRSSPGTTGLTNLGRVELPARSGSLTLERFHFTVSPSAFVDCTSTAATCNQQLTWNFICSSRVFEKGRAERLVEKIVTRLEGALHSEAGSMPEANQH